MKISYNWLKWYVPEIPEAQMLTEVFSMHLCEVEAIEKLADGNTIFDLNILPNRAHDLLSHQGVAKELSGQLGIAFKDPTSLYMIPESKCTNLKIEIQTPNCRRYTARIIRNVKVGPSPDWIVKHLESIGQRSINNIVDATNITMFDCGQPVHAFDLDKLENEKIEIKNATDGEKLELVGSDRVMAVLKNSDVVISTEERSLALAGIKGGTNSGIDENTRNILIEIANFDPIAVRKTDRRLGILSDAAKRFENDLSPELCSYAMREISALFLDPNMNCVDAIFEKIVDIYPNKQEERKITFTTEFINKKLGSSISIEEIETILKNYNFTYAKAGNSFEITVPAFRLDLQISEDMVEEIGRVYGYEKILSVLPKINFVPKENKIYLKTLSARQKLIADGYREVMTYAFANKGEVEVFASASDKNFLRTNLADGLKKSYELNKKNTSLLGIAEIKIFEIGTVFAKNSEEVHVGFADKKRITEITLEEYVAPEILLEKSSNLLAISGAASFKVWSQFPFMTRDIAVWVPHGTDPEILKKIYVENGTDLLVVEPKLFDQFSKGKRTSIAFRLVFQSMNRTLTDEEINEILDTKIYPALKNIHDLEIR